MVLTRQNIRDGILQRMLSTGDEPIPVLSDAEREASRLSILSKAPQGGDVWVFGYGSLIWNPAFHFVEHKLACVFGYHRQYCLWTVKGRGCPRRPGLILGLDRGGSCRGVAFRIAADSVDEETSIIWKREMVASSYKPTWVSARTEHGVVKAIAFVMDHTHERYAGRLSRDRIVETLAHATGQLGSSAEYLFSTAQHLAELGIEDKQLTRLSRDVAARLRESSGPE